MPGAITCYGSAARDKSFGEQWHKLFSQLTAISASAAIVRAASDNHTG